DRPITATALLGRERFPPLGQVSRSRWRSTGSCSGGGGRRGTVRDALRLVVGKELHAPFPSAAEFGELFSSALPTTVQQLAGGVVVGHRGAEPQRQHGRLAGGDPYDVVVLAGQPGERAVLGDLVGGQVGQVAHRHVRDDQREAFRADATQPVTG